jgi:hypothetical protein
MSRAQIAAVLVVLALLVGVVGGHFLWPKSERLMTGGSRGGECPGCVRPSDLASKGPPPSCSIDCNGQQGCDLLDQIQELVAQAVISGSLPPEQFRQIHDALYKCATTAYGPGDPAAHCAAIQQALNAAQTAQWTICLEQLEQGH